MTTSRSPYRSVMVTVGSAWHRILAQVRTNARLNHRTVIRKHSVGAQTTTTLAPMGTKGYNASTSAMYIRMQPCEASVPIELTS